MGHRDLSDLRDLSRVGARAGITTGATLFGPSLASWFLERLFIWGFTLLSTLYRSYHDG